MTEIITVNHIFLKSDDKDVPCKSNNILYEDMMIPWDLDKLQSQIQDYIKIKKRRRNINHSKNICDDTLMMECSINRVVEPVRKATIVDHQCSAINKGNGRRCARQASKNSKNPTMCKQHGSLYAT
jgi:hypothetical protein